jgi:hypothetical protein
MIFLLAKTEGTLQWLFYMIMDGNFFWGGRINGAFFGGFSLLLRSCMVFLYII